MKTMYYWEGCGRHCGEYEAESDEQALKMKPNRAILLYKESDTPDGTPFIIVWEAAPSQTA